jgi:hypothetical protein
MTCCRGDPSATANIDDLIGEVVTDITGDLGGPPGLQPVPACARLSRLRLIPCQSKALPQPSAQAATPSARPPPDPALIMIATVAGRAMEPRLASLAQIRVSATAALHCSHGCDDLVWSDRQVPDPNIDRVVDGVGDCRGHPCGT